MLSKEQLEEMYRSLLHIETVLSYFTVPTSKVSKRVQYLKNQLENEIKLMNNHKFDSDNICINCGVEVGNAGVECAKSS